MGHVRDSAKNCHSSGYSWQVLRETCPPLWENGVLRQHDRLREGKKSVFVIAIRGLVGISLWLSFGVWLVKEIRRDGVSPCGGGGETVSRLFEVKPLLLAAEPPQIVQ